jgi:hypothetical protein
VLEDKFIVNFAIAGTEEARLAAWRTFWTEVTCGPSWAKTGFTLHTFHGQTCLVEAPDNVEPNIWEAKMILDRYWFLMTTSENATVKFFAPGLIPPSNMLLPFK